MPIWLVLAGAEALLIAMEPRGALTTWVGPAKADDSLGYALSPGIVSVPSVTGRQVTYTVGADGYRASGPPAGDPRGTVVFMGCSFVFGAGLDDHETLPWAFNAATAHRYKVLNGGVSGWGAHQMLRLLETAEPGWRPEPVTIVYVAIPHHAMRAAGLALWDEYGPRYELDGAGVARLVGPLVAPWLRRLRQIRVAFVVERAMRSLTADPVDMAERFAAIVERAKTSAEQRHGARFVVLFWDSEATAGPGGRDLLTAVEEAFANRGVTYHRITSILPDYRRDREKYQLTKDDYHPNTQANQIVAGYLADVVPVGY